MNLINQKHESCDDYCRETSGLVSVPLQMPSQATHDGSQPTVTDRDELMALCINEVLDDYLNLKAEAIVKSIPLADQVLAKWMAEKAELKEKNRTDGSLFNPLKSIDIGETTHSTLLGDLLNPQGSHGQKKLFLESFLTLIGVPDPAKGKWVVTVEKGRIDILLCRLKPSSVVIIENKSNNANDQPNQLYRYWHQKIYTPYPKLDYQSDNTKRSFQIVYLPPDSCKKLDEDSLNRPRELAYVMPLHERIPIKPHVLPFQDLMKNWLAGSAGKIAATNFRLTAFLKFYSELWE
jgi:hypothetical protein